MVCRVQDGDNGGECGKVISRGASGVPKVGGGWCVSGEGEEYKEEGGYQEREEGGDIWMAYVEVLATY